MRRTRNVLRLTAITLAACALPITVSAPQAAADTNWTSDPAGSQWDGSVPADDTGGAPERQQPR